MTLSIFARNKT